jgi:hypothetical protein
LKKAGNHIYTLFTVAIIAFMVIGLWPAFYPAVTSSINILAGQGSSPPPVPPTVIPPTVTPPVYAIVGYIQHATIANLPSVNMSQLTHLIYSDTHTQPTDADDPTLLFNGTDLTTCVTLGHASNVKVLVSLWSGGAGVLLNIVDTPALLTELVENVDDLISNYDLDGVDINWEPWENQVPETNTLINELYETLNPKGKLITLAGIPSTSLFNVGLAASTQLDLINLMCYDMDYPDHSTYADSVAVINAWEAQGYEKNKLTMGIPCFAKDSNSDVAFYSDVVNELNPADSENQRSIGEIYSYYGSPCTIDDGVIWWNGPSLAIQKAQYVKAHGFGGCMVFDVGEDKLTDARSLLTHIYGVLG